MREYDGIIFDVDGTLWDSTPVVVNAFNEVVTEKGILDHKLTTDDLKRTFGKPIREIGLILFPHIPAEENWAVMQEITKRENELLTRTPPEPYPGIPEVFAKLSARYPLFIISNCQAGYIDTFLSATKTRQYITAYCCPDDTDMLKADNIVLFAQKYHLQHPVYIGDTEMDEQACEKAGTNFIYAAYGFGTASHPTAVIHSLKDLLQIL